MEGKDIPRKSDWTGCLSIATKSPLKYVYRTTEMRVKRTNNKILTQNRMTEIQ